ncbi:myb-like DNA-binding domain-containing protein [Vairimorpha necatrix]|uniref:Myb-like DNA-binding domain-containing protein n=1 Tax=Vairimorpha necatrix TaxID=6039 RepID=A0AAX4JD87_9MICR
MARLTKEENNEELEKNYQILADEDIVDLYAYKKKRTAVKWTQGEVEALKRGLKKFGMGNWTKILNDERDAYNPLRRTVDLKDKARSMDDWVNCKKKEIRDFYEVDADNNPILVKGEKVIYRCRVPFVAASKFAKHKNYTGEGNIIFRIAFEELGKKWVHVYSAKYVNDPNCAKSIKLNKIWGESPNRREGR